MEFRTKHAFGIVIGVAVTIVAANAFNMFLNWETAAIVCGLLLGLEAGFWSGIPGTTCEVHAQIFKAMFSNKFLGAIKTTAYYATTVAGIVLAAYTAFKTAMFLYHSQPWLLSWSIRGTDAKDFNATCVFAAAGSILLALVTTWLSAVKLSDMFLCDSHRRLKCCFLCLPTGLAIGLAMPIVFPLCGIAVALTIGLIGILCVVLLVYGLLTVAARHEAATITIGVIIGGISGLCYGHWTQLAFVPTTLSIMVGATVGLTSAYAAYRIGRKLQAVNKPATATAS